MPDLNFIVESAEPVQFAATPQMVFKLRIAQAETAPAATIQAIALRCQIRIEPLRRRYDSKSQSRLGDLFGQPDRWSQTMRTMLWQHASVVVPAFSETIVVDLPVLCSFDFNVAATKYFYALEEGEVPLCLLFSGTIFHQSENDGLQVAQIPWEKETTFRLPVKIWREMMEHYYPNSAWLCLRQDVFDQLADYKNRSGIPTWDQALTNLLAAEQEVSEVGVTK